MLREAMQIMADAELTLAAGVTPPAWVAPPALLDAMADLDMLFVASARDLHTPSPRCVHRGSGLGGDVAVFPNACRTDVSSISPRTSRPRRRSSVRWRSWTTVVCSRSRPIY